MFEAEKSALLNQALCAENSMASLASKYTQLLGHQNSKQKIHHLDKLKQDIFNLRKVILIQLLPLEIIHMQFMNPSNVFATFDHLKMNHPFQI